MREQWISAPASRHKCVSAVTVADSEGPRGRGRARPALARARDAITVTTGGPAATPAPARRGGHTQAMISHAEYPGRGRRVGFGLLLITAGVHRCDLEQFPDPISGDARG
jgi:hypothetical protein